MLTYQNKKITGFVRSLTNRKEWAKDVIIIIGKYTIQSTELTECNPNSCRTFVAGIKRNIYKHKFLIPLTDSGLYYYNYIARWYWRFTPTAAYKKLKQRRVQRDGVHYGPSISLKSNHTEDILTFCIKDRKSKPSQIQWKWTKTCYFLVNDRILSTCYFESDDAIDTVFQYDFESHEAVLILWSANSPKLRQKILLTPDRDQTIFRGNCEEVFLEFYGDCSGLELIDFNLYFAKLW